MTPEGIETSSEAVTVLVTVLPDGRMDTKNAARYLELSEKTLAMMRSAGEGPAFVKLGRVFYFKTDLDAWIHAGRATSTARRPIVGRLDHERGRAWRATIAPAVKGRIVRVALWELTLSGCHPG